MSQMAATPLEGGSVKIVDSRIFKASTQIAVAEVTVKPGAMRELHVSPPQSPWCHSYYKMTQCERCSGIRPRMSGVSSCEYSRRHPVDVSIDQYRHCREGEARVTLFGSSGNARTFDYRPGDISAFALSTPIVNFLKNYYRLRPRVVRPLR